MADYADLTNDDIEDLAHDEFIEDTILRLTSVLERLLIHREAISLTELVSEGNLDKISAFLALLFLSARGEVDMYQDEFYSELYVTPDAGDTLLEELATDDEHTSAPLEQAG